MGCETMGNFNLLVNHLSKADNFKVLVIKCIMFLAQTSIRIMPNLVFNISISKKPYWWGTQIFLKNKK